MGAADIGDAGLGEAEEARLALPDKIADNPGHIFDRYGAQSMNDKPFRPILAGQKALDIGVASELVDIMDVGVACAHLATPFAPGPPSPPTKHLGARISLTAVLHTWGSALTHHHSSRRRLSPDAAVRHRVIDRV
jgi:hypothetical protein